MGMQKALHSSINPISVLMKQATGIGWMVSCHWRSPFDGELVAPEGTLLQGRKLVEQGRDDDRVDRHEEDLQAKDEAPQVDGHQGPGMQQNPCEGCDDWRHHDQAQSQLQQITECTSRMQSFCRQDMKRRS